MTNTKLDKWAAEKVMGWRPMIQDEHTGLYRRGSNFVAFTPTTDANHDLSVRDRWLETATAEQRIEADRLLGHAVIDRSHEFLLTCWHYLPGDFTRAIHAAMDVRQ